MQRIILLLKQKVAEAASICKAGKRQNSQVTEENVLFKALLHRQNYECLLCDTCQLTIQYPRKLTTHKYIRKSNTRYSKALDA